MIFLFICIVSIHSLDSLDSFSPFIQQSLREWSHSLSEPTAFNSTDGDMKLFLFDDNYPNANCLDGSKAGYYYALNSSSENWIIFLQGGGLCVEPVDCKARMKNHLGSSKYWGSTHQDDKNMCSSSHENPFRTWNRIFVPYCTGDVHIGVLTEPDRFGFHFAGHLVVEAIIDHLFFSKNQKVGQVILTGESAGGIGTMHNADYVAEQLAKLDPAPRYWASPQGGFYFPTDTLILYPEMVLNLTLDFAFFAGSYLYDFFGHPYLDESCTKAHRLFPHQCWNQAVHYKHISSNLFLAENMYDSNQIGAVLGVNWYPNKADVDEYKTYFGASMKKSLQNKIKHSDGLFMPSCYEHTANLCMLGKSPKVEGKSYAQLFTEWLYQDHDEPLHYIDTCESSLPCNTYCKC